MNELNAIKTEYVQYIVIRIGDELYGIDILNIDNIERMQHITRVPKVPSYIKGVINLRGEVIPVMSLREKMFLPADEITMATRIIFLKLEQYGNMGIIVDEVKEVITLNTDSVEKISYESKEDKVNFISGVGKIENTLVSLLDINAVINDSEN